MNEIFLHQITNTDYVLVEADWPVEKAQTLIQNLNPSHVIIHRKDDGQVYYYLYTREDFLLRLQAAPPQIPLSDRLAMDLHEPLATSTLPDTMTRDDAPSRGVVMSNDRVAGFIDRAPSLRRGPGILFGGPGAPSATPPATLERSLMAEFPKTAPLNQTSILKVYLTSGGTGVPLSERVPVNEILDIMVEAKKGFKVVERDHDQLQVTDPPGKPLEFKLVGTAVGAGEITVRAYYKGQQLAGLRLTPEVLAAPGGSAVILRSGDTVSPLASKYPDLSLMISELPVNGKRGYVIYIFCDQHQMEKFGPKPFEIDPGQYFGTFYQDIDNYRISTPQDRANTMAKLEAKGAYLFQTLLPKELQEILWDLRDRIDSVFIQSEEPWIPWELFRLCGDVAGKAAAGPFWCESFSMSRWLPRIRGQKTGQPPENLTLNRIASVIPGNSNLACAAEEGRNLLSLGGGNRTVTPIPARFQELRKALAQDNYDVWHFSGHGGFCNPDPDRSVIQLEDDNLTPEDLYGQQQNFGRTRPLVFLNACQIGAGGMSLTGIGGWASGFLAAGAGAFIGPLWSVYDQSACDFAKNLYSRLIGGLSIGEAAKQARQDIKASGDPTWLAYSVFAYPLAKVI